jgi:hypothetical protein
MMHESPPSGGEKLLHFDTAFMISPLLTELKSGATEKQGRSEWHELQGD